VSGKRFARTSIVAAKKGKDIIAPFAYSGTMDRNLFEGWLEEIFVPELKNPEKSVLILDNASSHNKEAIHDIADEYGFKVIFLPPYSPDLNKIEKFWANVKKRLRLYMHKFSNFWKSLAHAFH
jgi:transposase